MAVTIQTVPNKEDQGGQTIQTVPVTTGEENDLSETWTTSTKTRTLTTTLPNSSTTTEVVLEVAKIPIESNISSQPQNSVKLWFSKNDKTIIGISCGFLFLMIVSAVFFQIRRKKASRRGENQAMTPPRTPKTPETPRGMQKRKIIRGEIRSHGV